MEANNTIYLSWEKIKELVETLARQVAEYSPDIVVAIGMGGWIPARLLKNHYKAHYYSILCSYYDENDQKTDKVRIIQDIGVDISGSKVLVLDEVADSGATLSKVMSHLKEKEPEEVRSAVLHVKKTSGFVPDYSAEDTGDEWLVYPWE